MEPRELLRRLMEERKLNPNSLAAATNHRTTQPQVYRFLNGLVKEPKRSTWEPVAQFFKVPVDAFFDPRVAERAWADRLGASAAWTPSQHTSAGRPPSGVAQEMSDPKPDDEPPQHTWEFILSAVTLPARFRLAAPDDALAPSTPRGTPLIFETDAPPVFGHGVLVEDAAGQRYVRKYAQGTGGRWLAVANNPAYLTIDSADGARVLAAVTWRGTGEV